MEYVAVDDTFGESGKPELLMKKYGLDDEHIIGPSKKYWRGKINFLRKKI